MYIHAFDSGLAILAEKHLSYHGQKTIITPTLEEFEQKIRDGCSGILIIEKGIDLPFKFMHTIAASSAVIILSLSGAQKPTDIPPGQFRTFEPNTFTATITSIAQANK